MVDVFNWESHNEIEKIFEKVIEGKFNISYCIYPMEIMFGLRNTPFSWLQNLIFDVQGYRKCNKLIFFLSKVLVIFIFLIQHNRFIVLVWTNDMNFSGQFHLLLEIVTVRSFNIGEKNLNTW